MSTKLSSVFPPEPTPKGIEDSMFEEITIKGDSEVQGSIKVTLVSNGVISLTNLNGEPILISRKQYDALQGVVTLLGWETQ